jgi:N-acetylneuraminate synthase/N,N'-diacetyllegionaminate synthase
MSGGMATLAELAAGVHAFRSTGNENLILLHCTSTYPTPAEDVHLRKIPTLARAFACPVGFSDHTAGTCAAIGAVALGACWIEKHFTLDRDLPGPDQAFSADPDEFRGLVQTVRTAEAQLGQSTIRPAASEAAGRRDFRLSCVAERDLPAGNELSAADLTLGRPGNGLAPRDRGLLVGRTLRRRVCAGEPVYLDDVV